MIHANTDQHPLQHDSLRGETEQEGFSGTRSMTPPPFVLAATPEPPPDADGADESTTQLQKKPETEQQPTTNDTSGPGAPDWPPMIPDGLLATALKANRIFFRDGLVRQWNPFEGTQIRYPTPKRDAHRDFAWQVYVFQSILQHFQVKFPQKTFITHAPNGIYNESQLNTGFDELATLKLAGKLNLPPQQSQFVWQMAMAIKRFNNNVIKRPAEIKTFDFKSDNVFDRISGNRLFSLKVGMYHSTVATVKGLLMELGYLPKGTKLTKRFTRALKKAVQKFQEINGVKGKKGQFDAATLKALDRTWHSNDRSKEMGYLDGKRYKVFKIPVYGSMGIDKSNDIAYSHIFNIPLHVVRNPRYKKIFAERIQDRPTGRDSYADGGEAEQGMMVVRVIDEFYAKVLRQLEAAGITPDAAPKNHEKGMESEMQVQEGREDLVFMKAELLELKAQAKKQAIREMQDRTRVGLSDELKALQVKIANLEARIVQERAQLGLSEAEEKLDEARFIGQFKKVAVQVGKQMLAGNLSDVAIFSERYKPGSKFAIGLDKVLLKLSKEYARADRLGKKALESLQKRGGFFGGLLDQLNKGLTSMLAMYVDPPNKEFRAWAKQEKHIHGILKSNIERYPILAHPQLHVGEFARSLNEKDDKKTKVEAIRAKVYALLSQSRQNIEKVELTEENVWQFPPIIAAAKERMGIAADSHYAEMIDQWKEEAAETPWWKDLIDWGLMIAALLSGPIGWMATAGSIVVGVHDIAQKGARTMNQRAAAHATLSKDKAILRDIPGWGWLAFDLAMLGLDLKDAAKIIGGISKPAKKAGQKASQTASTRPGADAAPKGAGKPDATGAKESAPPARQPGSLTEAETQVLGKRINKLMRKQGDNGLYNSNFLVKFTAKRIGKLLNLLDKIKDGTIKRKLLALLKNPRLLDAFDRLKRMLGGSRDLFRKVVRHMVGAGRRTVQALPEVLQRLKGKLPHNHPLFRAILTDVRIRMHFLREGFEATMAAFSKVLKSKGSNAKASIAEFSKQVGRKYRKTMDKMGMDELGRMHGKAFHTYKMPRKNRILLMHSHFSTAADMLRKDRKLSKELRKAYREFLKRDIIGMTLSHRRAKQRMEAAMDEFLQKHVKSQKDLDRLRKKGALPPESKMFQNGPKLKVDNPIP